MFQMFRKLWAVARGKMRLGVFGERWFLAFAFVVIVIAVTLTTCA